MDITVKDIMDTWTKQAGYPVIHVSRAGPTSITLFQVYLLRSYDCQYHFYILIYV